MCIMARYLLMLVASAGILGAALGLSGAANAATTDVQQPSIVATMARAATRYNETVSRRSLLGALAR